MTEVGRAVRAALTALPVGPRAAPPLVGCSGGADSVALAAAVARLRRDAHVAVVDHGLQPGSAEQADAAAGLVRELGLTVRVLRVQVTGPGGPEAAARRARRAALLTARPDPHSPVLLGHTLDDQSETVLLGLGRGSGPRSLAGMAAWAPPWLRPLLGVRRATTVAACAAAGLTVWNDPHNTDPRFTRVRVRHEVLPLLEDVLGGGVAHALARTAEQLREASDTLDELAALLVASARTDPASTDGGTAEFDAGFAASPAGPVGALRLDPLRAAPRGLRRAALRTWLTAADVTRLTAAHLDAADVLAAQGPDRVGPTVPGGLELVRSRGRLVLRPANWPGGDIGDTRNAGATDDRTDLP